MDEIINQSDSADVYTGKGCKHLDEGELDQALDCYLRALAIHRRTGSDMDIASDTVDIGLVYRLKGDLSRAMDCFDQVLDMYEKDELWRDAAGVLFNTALVNLDRGDKSGALEYLRSALDVFEGEGCDQEAQLVRETLESICNSEEENDPL